MKMQLRLFLSIYLLSLLGWHVLAQGPPAVTGSYKASGEIVNKLEDDSGITLQIAFDESYDAESNNAVFLLWVMGKNVSFFENFKTNQTFRYSDAKTCQLQTVDEWIKTKSPPSLMNYEDTNGTVRFSLKQLFSLSDNYLTEKNVPDTYRGIPARKWMYEIKGREQEGGGRRVLNVYAYWSDGSWNVTSHSSQVPLGYIVSKWTYKNKAKDVKLHESFINVYSFVPDTINHKLFEPVQGVVCPDRKQTLQFPYVFDWQAMAMHSELILPDYQEIRYVDTWYNPSSKLVRVDIERLKEEVPPFQEKERRYQSEMVSGEMGVVFRVGYVKGLISCKVIPLDQYEFDVQNLINFNLPLREWRIGKLFGLNDTTYVYLGKTTKMDIPCHLFQGIRTDWPEASLNVKSLWEWCFSVNMSKKDDKVVFRNGEFGLVSAQIKILESGKPSDYPTNFRMIHHFYDVNIKDPALMEAKSFDISRCFQENEKRRLQFEVDWKITDGNLMDVENATSDIKFLQKWKQAIYQFSEIKTSTLRVSSVTAMVKDKKLYIKFLLLGVHKDLPKSVRDGQKTAFQAEITFRNRVNDGKVFIYHRPTPNARIQKIYVVKHSVNLQLNRTFERHTGPTEGPTQPTTPKRFPFSLITEPEKEKSTKEGGLTANIISTPPGGISITSSPDTRTEKPEKLTRPKSTKYQGGAVASVSVAMLLVGITIGASGTFIKFSGMPTCLQGLCSSNA
ncbi:uncharacterized protein LOC118198977 [Stegodyphus dumicola]|uniref:uncharacterized protein LOC118198977 n=1 Tax=Stegodyphus dumicola TaxID=202533 RepID=UPI0015AA8231|nr:uncharacterized protein LOC118198977 [Stegodyphus dumicola]